MPWIIHRIVEQPDPENGIGATRALTHNAASIPLEVLDSVEVMKRDTHHRAVPHALNRTSPQTQHRATTDDFAAAVASPRRVARRGDPRLLSRLQY